MDRAGHYASRMSDDIDSRGVLRAIALFKLAKSALLVLVAASAFELTRDGVLDAFVARLRHLPLAEGHHALGALLAPLSSLTMGEVELAGLLASAYAVLFCVEGVGLWRGRRWAEYLTTLATASLIPLELWALFAEPTVLRGVAVLVNAGILVVLVVVLRRQHRRRVGAAG